MADVDDIIEYIKSLKRGFDKELFQSKVEDLAYAVDNEGLDYESFHTLFKVWLNLSIPITKWIGLGICLVPREPISERTVHYSLRWLMANVENQANFARIGFVLDWLTTAMENHCINMKSLDSGYEIFYSMISYEGLTPHCMKLVYTLTKPVDVTRRRVLELLDYAKKREGKKNMYRQIQVLLGLFKSYKPECVPNEVPSVSIHTSFRKLNLVLVERFKNCQSRQNSAGLDQQRLIWINPINSMGGRSKNDDPLVPNMEFVNIGAEQYAEDSQQKTHLDFTDAVSLIRGALQQRLRRPARLRSLLRHATGAALLALATDAEQAFLAHDLHHLLTTCFLEISSYSYVEKQDLLSKLSVLQRTLLQGIPVVTRFLAQYLPFWNEKDFFAEILELVEWVSVDDREHVICILDALGRVHCRSQPMEQCAIMKALTQMYSNIVFSSTRKQLYFMSTKPSEADYVQVLMLVSTKISDISEKGLQANPDDMRLLYTGVCAAERVARVALAAGAVTGTDAGTYASAGAGALAGAARGAPGMLVLALPLLGASATLLDKTAALLLMYRKIFSIIKKKYGETPQFKEQKQILKAYAYDFVNCFYEQCLTKRKEGLIFSQMHPQLVGKLGHAIPEAEAMFSVRNHLALVSYTYINSHSMDLSEADNNLLLYTMINKEFPNLSKFLQPMSDLR